jgi:hypothetical protein
MDLLEQELTRRLQNVDIFGDNHRADFAPTSQAVTLFDELKTVIAALQGAQGQQTASGSGAKGSTRAKSAILGGLKRDINRIADTAQQIKTLPDNIKSVLVRSPSREAEVVNQARVFVQTATPLWASFVAYELPANLLTEMQSDLDDYDAVYASQQSGSQSRIGAGTDIERGLGRGGEILDELRPIVKNKYDSNDAILREWSSATRYPGRDKTKPAPTPPPTV